MELGQILERMDEGFAKVHSRLDTMAEQTKERQLGCMARFSSIEQNIAVRTAINGITESQKALKVSFQSWLVRIIMGMMIVGMGAVVWKLFIGHIDMVAK